MVVWSHLRLGPVMGLRWLLDPGKKHMDRVSLCLIFGDFRYRGILGIGFRKNNSVL